jgi:hypothetical protein
MVDAPRNMEILAQNGAHEFDVIFLERPGGSTIQPSRNGDPLDKFDPTIPAQDDPADFITPTVQIWTAETQTLGAAPGAYNAPTVSGLVYGGTKGKFLVTLTGANTRLSADLVGERWALVHDTQINGNAFRTYEFFTVLSDGDALFGGDDHAYADEAIVKQRAGVGYADLGFADQAEFDDFVHAMNLRASAVIDEATNRDFVLHVDAVDKYDGTDDAFLDLRGYPVISIASVKEDGVALATTEYRLKPGQVGQGALGILERRPGATWNAWPKNTSDWERYEVTYTWGYQEPPHAIRHVAENLVVRGLQGAAAGAEAPGATSYSMDGFAVSYDKEVLRGLLGSDDQAVLNRFRVYNTGL